MRKSGGEAIKTVTESPSQPAAKAAAKGTALSGRHRHGRSGSLPKLVVLPLQLTSPLQRSTGRRLETADLGTAELPFQRPELRTELRPDQRIVEGTAEHTLPDLPDVSSHLAADSEERATAEAALEAGHFGDSLRRAREQRGMSAHDVAQKTRISVHWVLALETAKLDGLPAPVFVSGYLRSYAREVGLDGQELLLRYHELVQQRGHAAALAERGAHLAAHRTAAWRRPLLFAALALAIVFALLAVAWRRGAL